ncbi:MAG: serine hydrolase [Cyanobacteria bacterium J06632_22]
MFASPNGAEAQGAASRRPLRSSRRANRRQTSAWPPRATAQQLPQPPLGPRPLVWGVRILIIGVGVAALTGTLLSVLTPADTRPGSPTSGPTAAQTESVIVADGGESVANTLGLTRELGPLKAALADIPELTPGLSPSLFWVDLDTGAYVNLDGQQTVPAASTIKLPILVALFEEVDAGRISLEQTMRVQPEQVAGGSGDMQNQSLDIQYTVLEVATQMIINSDNTATNMVIDLLGGNDALNARFADWGLTSTVLNNPLPDLEGTNTTSPRDLVKMMALLHRGEQLTLRSRDRIFNILQRTYNKNLLASGVADGALVYNKTGDIGTLLGDVALVDLPNGKRYAVAALVARPENDGRARELIRRLSQTIYQVIDSEIVPAQSPQTDSDEISPTSETVDPGEGVNSDVSSE